MSLEDQKTQEDPIVKRFRDKRIDRGKSPIVFQDKEGVGTAEERERICAYVFSVLWEEKAYEAEDITPQEAQAAMDLCEKTSTPTEVVELLRLLRAGKDDPYTPQVRSFQELGKKIEKARSYRNRKGELGKGEQKVEESVLIDPEVEELEDLIVETGVVPWYESGQIWEQKSASHLIGLLGLDEAKKVLVWLGSKANTNSERRIFVTGFGSINKNSARIKAGMDGANDEFAVC